MFQDHGLLATSDYAIGVLAGATAGGSTTINWMTCLRPPVWALQEWETRAGMTGVTAPGFQAIVDDVGRRLRGDAGGAPGAPSLFATRAERILVAGGEARGVEAVSRHEGRDVPVHVRSKVVVA